MVDPQQRAIAFLQDAESGGTLGYYCTIVTNEPDQLTYRVYIPYLNEYRSVAAPDLLVTGANDSVDSPPEALAGPPLYELRFDHDLGEDNDEIRGVYRLPGGHWVVFTFRKCDRPYPDFRLRLPGECPSPSVGKLSFHVPGCVCLDRHFVLTALACITGAQRWGSRQQWK
jgi:hypothetical protein